MQDNNNDILNAIKAHVDRLRKNVANAIRDVDVPALVRYGGVTLVVLLVVIALAVGVLALVGKIFSTLLGKFLATPAAVFVVLLILRWYSQSEQDKRKAPPFTPDIGEVEDEHELVQDATFLVIQDVADYTPNLIMPSRPSTIECPDNPFTIEDGYVVHNFQVRTRGPVDLDRLKSDLRKTFSQKHRAHELNGFPRDYVEIDGGFYCPLQILGIPQDFGDFIQIAIVRTTAETVKLTRAHRMLNLDNVGHARRKRNGTLTDDEL